MGKLQIKPNTIMGKSFQFLICNQTDEDMSFKYEYKVISSNGVELKAKLDKKSYCSNHRQPLEKNTMKPITLIVDDIYIGMVFTFNIYECCFQDYQSEKKYTYKFKLNTNLEMI